MISLHKKIRRSGLCTRTAQLKYTGAYQVSSSTLSLYSPSCCFSISLNVRLQGGTKALASLAGTPRALAKQIVILCSSWARQPCPGSLPASATKQRQRGQLLPRNIEVGKKRKEKNAVLREGLQAARRSRSFSCLYCQV